ncbi:MAG: hypothetical protein ACJ74W_13795 [Pyrinomonadaceae bacterium]
MKLAQSHQHTLANELRQRAPQRGAGRTWDLLSVGAVAGLAGGVVSALFGALLTATGWFSNTAGPGVYVKLAGTSALLLTIPLLIFGACCLDVLEGRKHKARAARFNETR